MAPGITETPSTASTNGQANQTTEVPSATHPTRCLHFLELLNSHAHSNAAPAEAKVKLQVIIVGAGLGGLACAIALSRRGHKVTVLEQAPALAEVRRHNLIRTAYLCLLSIGRGGHTNSFQFRKATSQMGP